MSMHCLVILLYENSLVNEEVDSHSLAGFPSLQGATATRQSLAGWRSARGMVLISA